MGKVISLAQTKEDKMPHTSGLALCMGCRYEWDTVAPLKTEWLECPKCGLVKGRFKYNYMTGDTMTAWECDCGNDLFHITPDGVFCPNCGNWQEGYLE